MEQQMGIGRFPCASRGIPDGPAYFVWNKGR